MKANLDSIVRRLWQNKMLVSFIVVWAITFLFLLITDNRDLIYDSELYFGLSQSFTLDGDFSFRYFPETYRGYFYPFCLLVFRAAALGLFGDHFLGVWIFAALLLAITSCVLLPKLLELLTGRVNQPLACYFAPAALILFFWRGSVIYPDSDLPALCFMLAATVCLYAAGTRADTRPAPTTRRPSPTVNGDSATTSVVGAVGNRPTKANIKTALLYFLAGFFAYGAYNTRTIYLFSALGLVLIYVYLCYKRTSKSSSPLKSKPAILDVILLLLIIAAGVAVAAAPQLYINMHTQGLPSIAVVTTSFAEDTNLFVFQLYTGSVIWQYETYIGPPAVYSTPGVNILDPIVQTYSFPKVDSVFDYIKLVFAHPWEFAGIYFRHFVAALNPVFGESYVSDLLKPKVYLIFANALLMFVTALGFIAGVGKETGGRHALRSGRPRTVAPTTDVTAPTTNTTAPTGYYRRTFAKYLPFYPLLLPCLAILPSSMEARFMLPAYVLMYGLLAYAFDYKQIAALVKKRPVTCAAAFLLLFAFLLSTFQTIWAFTEHGLNIYPLR